MQADFWHAMWDSGVVGFHQQDINAYLKSHWSTLGLQGRETVLVPLCGKTLDMLWLKNLGHDVLGVELSQKALDEFLQENHLSATPVKHQQFCGYELDKLTLLCGDFFHLTASDCAEVRGVYDRAALVALPPKMRQDYVKHLSVILPVGSQILLVVMEYDEQLLSGPPFSVSEPEVLALFGANFKIQKLETCALQRKGVAVAEKVFLLQKQV